MGVGFADAVSDSVAVGAGETVSGATPSGDSVSDGVVVAVCDADSVLSVLSGVAADGSPLGVSVGAGAVVPVVVVPVCANAAGAESRTTGPMTAVAAASARVRRSFIRGLSRSVVPRGPRYGVKGMNGPAVVGHGTSRCVRHA